MCPGNASGVVVYFHVQEYPNLIQEVVYKNANHISQKDLDEMTRLRKGMPLDPATNRQACFAIQDHLKRRNERAHVSVDWRTHAFWVRRELVEAKKIVIIAPNRDETARSEDWLDRVGLAAGR